MAVIIYEGSRLIPKISELDRKINFYVPVVGTPDVNTGFHNVTYPTATSVWARVGEMDISRLKEVNDGRTYHKVIDIVCRHKAILETDQLQVQYKSERYEVEQAREVFGRKRFITFRAYKYKRNA